MSPFSNPKVFLNLEVGLVTTVTSCMDFYKRRQFRVGQTTEKWWQLSLPCPPAACRWVLSFSFALNPTNIPAWHWPRPWPFQPWVAVLCSCLKPFMYPLPCITQHLVLWLLWLLCFSLGSGRGNNLFSFSTRFPLVKQWEIYAPGHIFRFFCSSYNNCIITWIMKTDGCGFALPSAIMWWSICAFAFHPSSADPYGKMCILWKYNLWPSGLCT